MAQNSIEAFAARLPQWKEVQQRLATNSTPDQIVAIARQCGFEFSQEELRQNSGALTADHWPWGGKGSEVRHAFFHQQRGPRSALANANSGCLCRGRGSGDEEMSIVYLGFRSERREQYGSSLSIAIGIVEKIA